MPDADMLLRIAEVFGVSAGELLSGEAEMMEGESGIAAQLERMNEQLARKARMRRLIMEVVIAVVVVCAVAAIYPQWNEIWHEFGRNLYRIFHS